MKPDDSDPRLPENFARAIESDPGCSVTLLFTILAGMLAYLLKGG